MNTKTYQVSGMTCGHCVKAVSEEVGQVSGVFHVSVDLDKGLVTVKGSGIDDAAIKAAVDEAGYAVV